MRRNTKLNTEPGVAYESFLLRIRRTTRPGERCWALLVNVSSKEQCSFGSLDDLLLYLGEASPASGCRRQRKVRLS